jgi:uncharacterized phage infection (PIP) family protein YhgE
MMLVVAIVIVFAMDNLYKGEAIALFITTIFIVSIISLVKQRNYRARLKGERNHYKCVEGNYRTKLRQANEKYNHLIDRYTSGNKNYHNLVKELTAYIEKLKTLNGTLNDRVNELQSERNSIDLNIEDLNNAKLVQEELAEARIMISELAKIVRKYEAKHKSK